MHLMFIFCVFWIQFCYRFYIGYRCVKRVELGCDCHDKRPPPIGSHTKNNAVNDVAMDSPSQRTRRRTNGYSQISYTSQLWFNHISLHWKSLLVFLSNKYLFARNIRVFFSDIFDLVKQSVILRGNSTASTTVACDYHSGLFFRCDGYFFLSIFRAFRCI